LIVSDQDFALWAFGPVWEAYLLYEADYTDLMLAWNSRHGDWFRLKDTDNVIETMKRMKQIYEEHGKDKSSEVERGDKLGNADKQSGQLPSGVEAANMGSDEVRDKNPKARGQNGQKDAQSNKGNEGGRKGHKKGKAKGGREGA